MQTGSFNWKWIVISLVILSVSAYADVSSNGVAAAQKSLERTRLQLQEQGFKMDLTNFDFSTSPALRTREAILESAVPKRNVAPFVDHPDLMEATGSNNVNGSDRRFVQPRQWPTKKGQPITRVVLVRYHDS